MLDIVLSNCLRSPDTLMCDGALAISHDLDFGQINLSSMHDMSAAERETLNSWIALQPQHSVRPFGSI